MDKLLEKSLSLLGLSDLEIKLFTTSFHLGATSIPEIAKKAHLKRSTAYLVSAKLISEGLLLEDHQKYAGKVFTISPERLSQLLDAKNRQIRKNELDLQAALPELLSTYQISQIRPKITAYEGKSGLIKVWADILSTKGELLLWTNQNAEPQFFDQSSHDKFVTQRINRHIPIRVIAVNNPLGVELQEKDFQSLRQTKLMNSSANFTAETYIYDNKIAILDYNKDIICIIIESLPISTTYKSLFESQWQLLN